VPNRIYLFLVSVSIIFYLDCKINYLDFKI